MKRRKIKLFASVASFALVAAVMSFGVFAAINQAVTVTSSVSFTSSEVAGTFQVTVESNSTTAGLEKDTTAVAFGPASEDQLATQSSTFALGAIPFNVVAGNAGSADTVDAIVYTFIIDDLNFASTLSITPYIDVTEGEDINLITIDEDPTPVPGDRNLEYVITGAGADITNIAVAANTPKTITFTLSVADANVDVANTNISFAVSIVKAPVNNG